MQRKERKKWVNELMKEIKQNSKDNRKLLQYIKVQNRRNKELANIKKKKLDTRSWQKKYLLIILNHIV